MSDLIKMNSLYAVQPGMGNVGSTEGVMLSQEAKIGTSRTPLHAIVGSRLKSLPEDIRRQLISGEKQIRPVNLYRVMRVSGSSSVHMFTESDDKKNGVTNVANAKLDVGKNFVLLGMRLLHATLLEDNDSAILSAMYSASLPVSLYNGNFSFTVGDFNYIEDAPVSQFRKSETDANPSGYFDLKTVKFIDSQKRIDVEFRTVEGTSIPEKSALRLELVGAVIA